MMKKFLKRLSIHDKRKSKTEKSPYHYSDADEDEDEDDFRPIPAPIRKERPRRNSRTDIQPYGSRPQYPPSVTQFATPQPSPLPVDHSQISRPRNPVVLPEPILDAPRPQHSIWTESVASPIGSSRGSRVGKGSDIEVITSPRSARRIKKRVGPDLPPCLLIGIDFGTTYSGAAWAYSKQPNDIKIVTNWDSQEFQNSDKGKAPSRIAYGTSSNLASQNPFRDRSPDGRTTSPVPPAHNSGISWGYGIGEMEAVEWFKMLLLDKADLDKQHPRSAQLDRARAMLEKVGKTAIEVVADYLRLLWSHIIKNIEKEYGETAMKGLPFRVVLTVPAVWTTRAVSRMRQAAKQAGILNSRDLAGETQLHFIAEPEAAAIATFDDLRVRPNFAKGDTFVVCDAGGGTVDLITYKVIQTDPMQLAECVEGTGKLCGAVFLDQDFESLMKQLVGEAWNVPDAIIKNLVETQWENGIKRGFEGQDRDWKITLPIECVMRGSPPFITLNRGHVREIFEAVISQIRKLVNDQISAVEEREQRLPKAVVLVGGFGSCRYLYNILNKENKARGIEVLQLSGTKPWTAICSGAVLRALTNSNLPGTTILSRVSRCNYGTIYNAPFDKKVHLESEKYKDGFTGEYFARDQMQWFLRRGDDISQTQVVREHYHLSVPIEESSVEYVDSSSIYSCEKHDPPIRRNSNVKYVGKMETVRDTTVLPDKLGADKELYKLVSVDIQMTVIGTAVEFSSHYGDEQGAKRALDIELEGPI